MSRTASENSCGLAAKPRARRPRWWFVVGFSLGAWACATYEPSQTLGHGGGHAGPEETAGSGSETGGSAGAGSSNIAGSVPQAGSVATNGGAGGASGSGGAGGSLVAEAGAAGAMEGGSGGEGGSPEMPEVCADCEALKSALVHRYDFEGTGVTITDRVGTAHGTLQGGAMLETVNGKGVVDLSGGTQGSYVDLPNGLLSSLTNATLEAWVTWGGGDAWQRIFDFGDSTATPPEDSPANGKSYLFLTPMTDTNGGGVMRAVYSLGGGSAQEETRAAAEQAMPQTLAQAVVVVDAAGGKLLLYLDGALVGQQAFSGSLASINDVNCWLGRSQYDADPELAATYHDFRIYKAALSASQIATSFAGGPDPAFLAP